MESAIYSYLMVCIQAVKDARCKTGSRSMKNKTWLYKRTNVNKSWI